MEESMFTDDEEVETPRTHILQFLSNVATDPLNGRSSSRNTQSSRSFVRTPDKKASKAKKQSLRLSSSLPLSSPGSSITPKTNLQQLLLGTDSAKTPLDRRVASARFTKSSSKSSVHLQVPAEWGQKVSLSPLFVSSPSRTSGRFDGGSPSKAFKRPQRHRSFRIPDLPTKNVHGSSLRNSRADTDKGEDHLDDEDWEVENETDGDDSPLVVQRHSQHHSKSTLQLLKQVDLSLQTEKAKEVYELRTTSTDEEYDSDEDVSSSKKQTNLSLGRSTSLKTGSVRRNHSTVAQTDNISNDEDDGDVYRFRSITPSKGLFVNALARKITTTSGTSETPNKSIRKSPRRKSSQPSTPFQVQSSSSKMDSSLHSSAVVNSFQSKRLSAANTDIIDGDEGEKRVDENADVSDMSVSSSSSESAAIDKADTFAGSRVTPARRSATKNNLLSNEKELRTSTSSKKLTPRKKSLTRHDDSVSNNSVNKSRTKSSQANTPLMIQSLRKASANTSVGTLLDRSRSGSQYFVNDNNEASPPETPLPSPRRSPRKDMNTSGAGKSESSKTVSNTKRLAPDVSDMEVPIATSLSLEHSVTKRRRKVSGSLNELLNETNPSSSTPFKRSRSVFSSTRMQASSASGYSGAKDADVVHEKSTIAIGDLSPIRAFDEDGPDGSASDPVGSVKEDRSRSKLSSVSQNKDKENPTDDDNPEEWGQEESDNETALRTPVLDMRKRPPHMSASKSVTRPSKAVTSVAKPTKEPLTKNPKPARTSAKKKKAPPQCSYFPRAMIKSLSERYSSFMKIDKEALDELEDITEQFMDQTMEAATCYAQHAGRKTITDADFVLMMKKQRLIKCQEDLYDLIREHLPMEYRIQLIPCFPTPSDSHR